MPVVKLLSTSLVVTAAVVVLGVVVSQPEKTAEPPAVVQSVPLTDYDTSTVAIARAAFCDQVSDKALAAVLSSGITGATSYGNGERSRITDDVRDVSHEFNCAWTSGDGSAVRAWVFAPPITPGRAAALVEDARQAKGCEVVPGAPEYGDPSLALACRDGATQEMSFRGLFGDAWLTCAVTAPLEVDATQLGQRTGRWCVSVAQAATADAADAAVLPVE